MQFPQKPDFFCLRVLSVYSVLSTWTELVPNGMVIFTEVFRKWRPLFCFFFFFLSFLLNTGHMPAPLRQALELLPAWQRAIWNRKLMGCMFINNVYFQRVKCFRVLILDAVFLSKLYSKIIGLFISLFLLWQLRKTVKSDQPVIFIQWYRIWGFTFCTGHHLAKNSVFGQKRFLHS